MVEKTAIPSLMVGSPEGFNKPALVKMRTDGGSKKGINRQLTGV